MKPEFPAPAQRPDISKKSVWLQTPDSLVRKEITTGLSDGVMTIVKEGLNPGDTVVLSTSTGNSGSPEMPTSNPFMPRPPQRR
jgi:hypothetical protein